MNAYLMQMVQYMAIGADKAIREQDSSDTEGGHLETMDRLSDYVTKATAWCRRADKARDYDGLGFMGVFPYEVPEELGAFIVAEGFPAWPVVRAKLAELYLQCATGTTYEVDAVTLDADGEGISLYCGGLDPQEVPGLFWGLYRRDAKGFASHVRDYKTQAAALKGKAREVVLECFGPEVTE